MHTPSLPHSHSHSHTLHYLLLTSPALPYLTSSSLCLFLSLSDTPTHTPRSPLPPIFPFLFSRPLVLFFPYTIYWPFGTFPFLDPHRPDYNLPSSILASSSFFHLVPPSTFWSSSFAFRWFESLLAAHLFYSVPRSDCPRLYIRFSRSEARNWALVAPSRWHLEAACVEPGASSTAALANLHGHLSPSTPRRGDQYGHV